MFICLSVVFATCGGPHYESSQVSGCNLNAPGLEQTYLSTAVGGRTTLPESAVEILLAVKGSCDGWWVVGGGGVDQRCTERGEMLPPSVRRLTRTEPANRHSISTGPGDGRRANVSGLCAAECWPRMQHPP